MFALRDFRRVSVLVAGCSLLALVAAGCGDSPTSPGPVPGTTGSSFPVSGEAVIDGQVTSGDTAGHATTEAFAAPAADPGGIKVTVVGTGISATTDATGHFRLPNVPSGNVQLGFESSDVDAQVGVEGVGSAQHVTIMVEVQGGSATILQDDREPLEEFEGAVTDVDPFEQILTLDDGVRVQGNDDTWFDTGGDVSDFSGLVAAFDAGQEIEVEGKGTDEGDRILATAIKVEVEEEDLEFDGEVLDVTRDPDTMTVAHQGGEILVCVDAANVWSPDSVFDDFDTLADAFELGNDIKVDGDGVADASCPDGVLATEIEAEVEETKFKGLAESVDLSTSTVTLDDGTVVLVDEDTVWETPGASGGAGLGNIDSLSEIQHHLDEGTEVEVEGEGWVFDEAGTILALEIEAKPEDDDEEDDLSDADFGPEIEGLEELITRTQEVAADSGLNGGQTHALVVKLQNAIASLERGNADAATGQIGAYINQVNAFRNAGFFSSEQAAELTAAAQAIIDAIQAKA